MYTVVSKWNLDPTHDSEVRESARRMMAELRSWPDVIEAYNVEIGPHSVLAIITYASQGAYERLIQDADGPFARAAAEHQIERYATWEWSERGERDMK